MAPKAKKRGHHGQKMSQNQREETTTNSSSWPDLPRPLLITIRNHPRLMRNMTFGVTTQSWRSKPAPCSPSNQLQLLHTTQETRITRFSIAFPPMWHGHWRYYRRELNYWHPWTYFVGYSNDVLVARGGPNLSEVYLWNPADIYLYSCLPPWDCRVPFKRAVVNFPYSGISTGPHRIVMVVTGMSRPAFMFSDLSRRQPGDFKWVKYDCNVEDPNYGNGSERPMEFANAIGANGKFYALSSQGTLAVIEYADSGAEFVALCRTRVVPNASWRSFRECLLEIEGEVLVVLLVSGRTMKVVDDVEVLRLNVDNKSWTKASNIGNRALFMGANFCLHVLVSELEEGWCRRNCIYFVQKAGDHNVWWVFDMEKSRISRCWNEEDCPRELNLNQGSELLT